MSGPELVIYVNVYAHVSVYNYTHMHMNTHMHTKSPYEVGTVVIFIFQAKKLRNRGVLSTDAYHSVCV